MFREAFNLLDLNGDGTISRDELLGAGSSLNLGRKSKRSSELSFSQFMELMIVSMRDLDVEQELIEAFKLFDRDGNCRVSVKEVRTMMGRIDEVSEGREMLREFHDAVGAECARPGSSGQEAVVVSRPGWTWMPQGPRGPHRGGRSGGSRTCRLRRRCLRKAVPHRNREPHP